MNTWELLAVDQKVAINYFGSNLLAVIRTGSESAEVSEREILYASSMLAHFSLTSTVTTEGDTLPTATSWIDLLNQYSTFFNTQRDPKIMEHAAGNSLLLLGFFRRQIYKHYRLSDCYSRGKSFYHHAASGDNSQMMLTMEKHFVLWVNLFSKLNRHLAQQRYLINPPTH